LGVGAGVMLLIVNYVAITYGSSSIRFFRLLKRLIEDEIVLLFKDVPIVVVLALALLSGVAEEVFFRGVLQAQIGIIGASVIFGAAHIWRKTALSYGVYAMLIGGYFGGLYRVTGNLWVPIVAHIVNNFIALLYYTQVASKTEQLRVSQEQEGL